ncbi:MAG TPA: hypothetical protein VFD03_11935 [Clostridia bacterium]|nr:hypothetical protein [Clostridia bacterium]
MANYVLQNPVGAVYILGQGNKELPAVRETKFEAINAGVVNMVPVAVITMPPAEEIDTSTVISWRYNMFSDADGDSIEFKSLWC